MSFANNFPDTNRASAKKFMQQNEACMIVFVGLEFAYFLFRSFRNLPRAILTTPAAYPDGQHGAGCGELLKEHRLRHIGVQVSNVEGGHRVVGSAWIHDVRSEGQLRKSTVVVKRAGSPPNPNSVAPVTNFFD